jgi:NAD(P)-dependent dehydrogenase (short-subunit alcohol dehydrogenase family)
LATTFVTDKEKDKMESQCLNFFSRGRRYAYMKIALITGANKGIGREVAFQLAARGFHVFVGARSTEAGLKTAEAITKKGGKATFLEMDVSDPLKIAEAAKQFATHSDHLDVLVNNAAIKLDGDIGMLNVPEELIRETFETNTLGPWRVTRAFAALLSKSSAPRVINVSSGGGQLADGAGGWAPAYCISKTALNGVTSQLAVALPNVAVNSVCPGWVNTDMGGKDAPRTVQQGADTIVWLASEAPQTLGGKFLRDRQIIPW